MWAGLCSGKLIGPPPKNPNVKVAPDRGGKEAGGVLILTVESRQSANMIAAAGFLKSEVATSGDFGEYREGETV